jgi:hypothetical protein
MVNLNLIRRELSIGSYNNFSYFKKNNVNIINSFDNFISENFYNNNFIINYINKFYCSISILENKTIAFFVDDITIENKNTLAKLIFDIIRLLKDSYQKFIVIPYRCHGFGNIVRFPQNHFWNHSDINEFKNSMHLDEELLNKVEIIPMENILKGKLISFEVAFFFPFRMSFIDNLLAEKMPSIFYEMMSYGPLTNNNASVLIPNGIPRQGRPVKNLISTVYAIPPVYENESNIKSRRPIPFPGRNIISISANMKSRCGDNLYNFKKFISNYLNRYEDAKCSLIGFDYDPNIDLDFTPFVENGRLILKNFSLDLNSECSNASIYVHPPIFGGGRSTYIAASNCIWTLSLDYTDAARWVHPEFIFDNEESYYSFILESVNDIEKITLESKKSAHFSEKLLNNIISKVDYIYALEKAKAIYKLKKSSFEY